MKIKHTEWVAGLLEGEGCFLIRKNGLGLTINCTMTDRDVLEKLCSYIGVGSIRTEKIRGTYKQAYTWRIGGRREIIPILKQLLPLMGKRRSQRIEEMLNYNTSHPLRRQPRGEVRHGTRSRYNNYNCRCESCRAAEHRYYEKHKKNTRKDI